MKLLIKERLFTWFDAFDVIDENEQVVYNVKGHLSWGHLFYIYNQQKEVIGKLKEKVASFAPKFEMIENNKMVGTIKQNFSLIHPKFTLLVDGWQVNGDFLNWNYTISLTDQIVATIKKEIFHLGSYYVIDVVNPNDALKVLMVVLTIQAIHSTD